MAWLGNSKDMLTQNSIVGYKKKICAQQIGLYRRIIMSKHWDYKYFDYFINQEYIEYKDSDDYSFTMIIVFAFFVLGATKATADDIFSNYTTLLFLLFGSMFFILKLVGILMYHYKKTTILKIYFLNNDISIGTQFRHTYIKDIEILDENLEIKRHFFIFDGQKSFPSILLKAQGVEYLLYYNPEHKEKLLEKLREYERKP